MVFSVSSALCLPHVIPVVRVRLPVHVPLSASGVNNTLKPLLGKSSVKVTHDHLDGDRTHGALCGEVWWNSGAGGRRRPHFRALLPGSFRSLPPGQV